MLFHMIAQTGRKCQIKRSLDEVNELSVEMKKTIPREK